MAQYAENFEEVCFQNVVEPKQFEPEDTNELQRLEASGGRETETADTEAERLEIGGINYKVPATLLTSL